MKSKQLYYLLLFVFAPLLSIQAQSFKDGLNAYEKGDYTSALSIFKSIDSQEATLFTGKTLFLLNRLDEARLILLGALSGDNNNLIADALYTLSLVYVVENKYAKSLDYLNEIQFLEGIKATVKNDATRQFNIINSFLSFNQRVDVLKESEFGETINEVLKEGIRIESQKNAGSLLVFAERLAQAKLIDSNFYQQLEQLYRQNNLGSSFLPTNTPEGFSYTIGVLLPTVDKTSPLFSVSRDIYQGMRVAIEEHNTSSPNKVFLSLAQVPDSTNVIANQRINESVDVIVGPLTSTNAKELVIQAEALQIPTIAPLANNDSLNIDNPYFFQLNPTFKTRGIQVANFAIKTLKVDTVAIMVDRQSMGYLSALAFKEEMERNNVHVAYFFAEPFESTAYDISEYTKYFTSDPIMKDSLGIPELDAIYLPYTGEQSETLIDLTLTDLEAGKSTTPILGSQDWGYIELSEDRLKRFTIYFPDAMIINEQEEKIIQFRQNYMDVNNGETASIYSFLGYDISKYLIEVFTEVKNPAYLKQRLVLKNKYIGLGNQIKFDENHVNTILSIYKMDKEGIIPINKN